MDGYHLLPDTSKTFRQPPPPPSVAAVPGGAATPALDTTTLNYMKTLRLKHFRSASVPWRSMGQYKYRIVEDGTNTQDRLSVVESAIPPKSHGPIFHFHEMHDETFYVTEGMVRFHCPGQPSIDAGVGDMVIVPTRMPHRFSNPFEKEGKFVSTNTPSHYARYFYYLEYLIGEGNELTPEVNKAAMRRFATVPLQDDDIKVLERELAVDGTNGVNGHQEEDEKPGPDWKTLD